MTIDPEPNAPLFLQMFYSYVTTHCWLYNKIIFDNMSLSFYVPSQL